MCIEPPKQSPHPFPQSLKHLLARPWIHRVISEVVEQDAIDDDEADQTPLYHLCPLVPLRPYRLHLYAAFELALEPELLLVRQGAQIRRPFLLGWVFVARKVKGWQCVLVAAEKAVEEAQHGRWLRRFDDGDRAARVTGRFAVWFLEDA